MSASIKFRCRVEDFQRAVKSKCDIDDIVIEDEADIDGLAEALLGVISAHYTLADGSKLDGKSVIVNLHSKEDFEIEFSVMDRHTSTSAEREADIKRWFTQEVKELQKLITSEQ